MFSIFTDFFSFEKKNDRLIPFISICELVRIKMVHSRVFPCGCTKQWEIYCGHKSIHSQLYCTKHKFEKNERKIKRLEKRLQKLKPVRYTHYFAEIIPTIRKIEEKLLKLKQNTIRQNCGCKILRRDGSKKFVVEYCNEHKIAGNLIEKIGEFQGVLREIHINIGIYDD